MKHAVLVLGIVAAVLVSALTFSDTGEAYTQQTFQAKDVKAEVVTIRGASNWAECYANARRMGFTDAQIRAPNAKCVQLFGPH
jgi:hypothetical protein